MSLRRPSTRRRGITLLEMLLAIGLLLMTMATLFLFYTIALDATARAGKFTVRTQQARVVLQQMAREISQAAAGAADKGDALTGKMHSLTIQTSGLPDPALMYTYGLDEKPPLPSSDMRQVDYYLAVDPDSPDEAGNPGVLGLVRREQKQMAKQVVNLDTSEVLDEVRMMAPEVQYIRFRYFDGATWQDVWTGGAGVNSLPQAVKIEIGFAPDAEMLNGQETTLETDFDLLGNPEQTVPVKGRYSVVVRLPMANAMMASLKAAGSGLTGSSMGSGLSGGGLSGSGLSSGLSGSSLH
jgi:type II secretory pathway pseudopilin PulG